MDNFVHHSETASEKMKPMAVNIKQVFEFATQFNFLEERFRTPQEASEEREDWIHFLEVNGFRLVDNTNWENGAKSPLPTLTYEHPEIRGGIQVAASYVDWYCVPFHEERWTEEERAAYNEEVEE
jgi:hypothetical protein